MVNNQLLGYGMVGFRVRAFSDDGHLLIGKIAVNLKDYFFFEKKKEKQLLTSVLPRGTSMTPSISRSIACSVRNDGLAVVGCDTSYIGARRCLVSSIRGCRWLTVGCSGCHAVGCGGGCLTI